MAAVVAVARLVVVTVAAVAVQLHRVSSQVIHKVSSLPSQETRTPKRKDNSATSSRAVRHAMTHAMSHATTLTTSNRLVTRRRGSHLRVNRWVVTAATSAAVQVVAVVAVVVAVVTGRVVQAVQVHLPADKV